MWCVKIYASLTIKRLASYVKKWKMIQYYQQNNRIMASSLFNTCQWNTSTFLLAHLKEIHVDKTFSSSSLFCYNRFEISAEGPYLIALLVRAGVETLFFPKRFESNLCLLDYQESALIEKNYARCVIWKFNVPFLM